VRFRGHVYRVDWGHLAFLTLIAAAVLWYLFDARSVSLKANNLLLVQPLAIFALGLYLLIIPQCFRRIDAEEAAPEPASEEPPPADALPTEIGALLRTGALAAALGLMVVSLNVVGFDIAIWLFCIAAMAICGERRPLPLLVFPLAVTLAMIYGFRALMPYPMITTIL